MFTDKGRELVEDIKSELVRNGNKLSFDFITKVAESGDAKYEQLGNARVCVITLPTGHEVIGYAQVLDIKNDDAEIGNKVAYENARDQLWSTLGSIAKLMIK